MTATERQKQRNDLKKATKKTIRRLRSNVDPETFRRLVNKFYIMSL